MCSTIFFILYLIYLSVVDIKLHMLEYWQTGLLFAVSVINTITYAISETIYSHSIGASVIPPWKFLLNHLGCAACIFIFILLFALIKKNGMNAFGGADIWAITAVALAVGFHYIQYLFIIMCVSFLLFAFLYKIVKKKKVERVAFLPFISIGTILTLSFTMV